MSASKISESFLKGLFFYSVSFAALLFILQSHPFMKIPFDIWEHLMRIVSIYDTGEAFVFWPEDKAFNLNLWHRLWATIFHATNVSDVFAWAKIIHVTQFLLAAWSIYFFSITVLAHVNSKGSSHDNSILALFSSILWFVGNGTPSILQQAWINWYSVTYQGLTIPLFWVAVALTIRLFYSKEMSQGQRILHTVLITLLSILVLFAHPTEFIFYLVYLSVFVLLNFKHGWRYIKEHTASTCLGLLSLTVFFWVIVKRDLLPLPVLLHDVGIHHLLQQIKDTGDWVTLAGGNRFPHAFSEIAIFSLVCACGYRIYLIAFRPSPDLRVYDSVLLSSLIFVAIPLQGWLAGLIGIITHKEIVWRFFFGSAWFVFLPYLLSIVSTKLFRSNTAGKALVLIIGCISLFLLLSRFCLSQAFYLNSASVLSLLDRNVVGLQYSSQDLELLSRIVERHDSPSSDKINMFYIRGDLAPIVRTVLRKYVYADRRHLFPIDTFFERALDDKYNIVDVELPPDFPKDDGIFRYFNLEKKY